MRALPEWIGTTDDTAIPPRVRMRIWERDDGTCQGKCGRKLRPGDDWHLDHITAICNGGENRENNLHVKCSWCHQDKTRADVKQKSRDYAVRRRHAGIKPKRKFRGWRNMRGEAVFAASKP